MRSSLKQKIIQVCQQKITQKGETVGLSFYAFFANRNDDPDLLMEAHRALLYKLVARQGGNIWNRVL